MKTIHYSSLLISGVFFVFQSCSPVMYSATGANTPMFTQKGEFNVIVSSAASTSDEEYTDAAGFAGHAAYAVSDKWAAITSFYSMNNADDPFGDDWDSKGSYFEMGGGRFGTLKNKKISWEAFGGFGLGSNNNQQENNQMDANHIKIFVQPSGGVTTRFFDFIVTPRVSFITFTSKNYSFSDPSMKGQADKFFNDQGSKLLFEPCFTLRAGYENFKLQAQYSFTTFNADYNDITPVNNRYASVGIYFLFSKRYNKK